MKVRLIKIMSKFDTPLKETITALFPRELEETLKENYILVSDDKYKLLRFNHVEVYTYTMIDITTVHKMVDDFDYKEYHIIKEIVKCEKSDIVDDIKTRIKTIKDKKNYNVGDSILYYNDVEDEKVYHVLATLTPDYKLYVTGDFSFETTKDSDQFGVVGKIDPSINTAVTKDVGGIKGGDSIKGMTYTDILTKAFGLEPEFDEVGHTFTKTTE